MLDYNDVTFYGKRIDNDEWVRGFFTKEQRGSVFVPVIQMIKEWDSGDYIESYEIDGNTLRKTNPMILDYDPHL